MEYIYSNNLAHIEKYIKENEFQKVCSLNLCCCQINWYNEGIYYLYYCNLIYFFNRQ
jgi:hypothetical protein